MIHWRRFTHTHKILYANFYCFDSYIIFIYWICISIHITSHKPHYIYIGKFNQRLLSLRGRGFFNDISEHAAFVRPIDQLVTGRIAEMLEVDD